MIRELIKTDIPDMIKMRIAEQQELYGDAIEIKDYFYKELEIYFTEVLSSTYKITLVDVENEVITATCSFNITQQPPQIIDNGCYAYMCNVYTLPAYRRRGKQKHLFDFGMYLLKKLNVSSVYFDSTSENEIAFAIKKGFQRRNDYYSLKI